ncbi:long-chain-fatty-acid--CoA ligase [Fulvitalea axinellae]|uniref:Long-chain-fatty-acid--CoA ligase n=1 Tax=Fulvitalea axinellae TaxID=1182444 RepID=A0AAU9DG63_9BACT|nr:long-chain-fatty-acid--CoA ligase [Fulvitalea axinellae]
MSIFDKKPWLGNYPKGVPVTIDPNRYGSMLELFQETVAKFGDAPAYQSFADRITFNELDTLTDNFASFLRNHLKLEKGDRIALQVPNLIQYPVAMFGALKAGLVVVNTNPLYTPREMEHQFTDAGVKAILIYENFAHNLEKIIHKIPAEHVIVTGTGDMLKGMKRHIVNFAVRYVKKMVPAFKLKGAYSFRKALALGAKKKFTADRSSRDDIAFLQYTGGTTGVSKGAMLTHGNIIGALEQSAAWLSPMLVGEKDMSIITALPLYHIFALTANCLLVFKLGGLNILVPNARDFPAFIKIMKDNPFNMICGVNTLFNALMNHPDFASINFSSLKVSLGGGMAVQDAVAKKWQQITGCVLSEAYGLTETSPGVTINPLDGTARMGSIGLPFPSTEVKIVKDDGSEAEVGGHGELCVRGPQVMLGYWNRVEETTEVLSEDGWFRTGDIATVDEDGYFKLVDRKKEMILVSGFNVYPNEVENVLASYPKVLEVGAIGIPHERSNEAVKVFVVKKDESLTKEELLEFCKDKLTAYKIPKEIEFRTDLPKSNVGKILRRVLKEQELEKRDLASRPGIA